jgi:hypothetical protein
MTLSSTSLSRSYSSAGTRKSSLAIKVAIALLVTAAAALILIHAEARGGLISADLDLMPLLY